MTKYQSKTTVDAIQFDGTHEMAHKYGISYLPGYPQEHIKPYFGVFEGHGQDAGFAEVHTGDWLLIDNGIVVKWLSDNDFREAYEKVEK